MRLALRRAAAASASVVLLGGLTAACGNGSDDSSATEQPHQAALLSNLSDGDSVEPADFVKIVSEGVEKSTTAHMTMTTDLGSTGTMTAEGDVDYTSSPASVAMKMTLPGGVGGDMDVRMVDGVMYLSMGDLTQGKFWKIDPADPDGPLASMGLDKMMDQMDPAKALTAMQGGISKVTYVGAEDGLDHYELTVDMKKLMSSMGVDTPQGLGSKLPDAVTYDLWLDDQGRFSKMSMDELPMGAAGTGSMQMTVTDWGEDVSIEAPPADQVTKMPAMPGMTDSGGSAPGV